MPVSAIECPIPGAFVEGTLNGQWVGVVLNFAGDPGAPHTATVYTTTLTPGGIAPIILGRVEAHGEGAAELNGMFVGDTLYIVNSRYAPGSSDKRYEYFAIQRFGVHLGQLISEGEGIINLSRIPVEYLYMPTRSDCSDRFDRSLRKVIEAGKLETI